MNKQKVLVNFILDKSGSMTSVCGATISGFNEYLGSLKKDDQNDYEFNLTLFDTDWTSRYNSNIKYFPELTKETYMLTGNTALYDAVCSTIKLTKEKTEQKVIVVIMTDGEENSSKEYTEKDMKSLIEEREKQGNWKFVYLGANQDSYAKAQKFGININATANFNATNTGMKYTMYAASNATMNYSRSAVDNKAMFFSQSEQDDIQNAK